MPVIVSGYSENCRKNRGSLRYTTSVVLNFLRETPCNITNQCDGLTVRQRTVPPIPGLLYLKFTRKHLNILLKLIFHIFKYLFIFRITGQVYLLVRVLLKVIKLVGIEITGIFSV